jgi:hypothetical protein
MPVVDMSIEGGARLEGGESKIAVGDMEALGVVPVLMSAR